MIDDISKLISNWMTGKRSNKLMNVVMEAMTEARQKVRASDSPFKSLARKCIDKAEDAYQEAIYQLKDGDPRLCFQYCKQGLKFLSLAMLHLTDMNERETEPIFDDNSSEKSVLELSESIARFKTSVEYTNAEVTAEQKERLHEVVKMFFDSVACISAGEDESAARMSQGGLLYMYLLGREMEDKLQAAIVSTEAIELCKGSSAARIIELVNQLADTQKLLAETQVVAHGRIKLYMDAAHRTIDQCIIAYLDSDADDISRFAKAGAMEIRMANRLIEYAKYPGRGPEPEDDTGLIEELNDPAHDFRRRVARLQRLLRDKDEEVAVVRRLSVVNSYINKSRSLLANGDYSEAERYARSAHLDIDFARQLLIDKHATYSDLI